MGRACRRAVLILVCVGLVLSASASAQDSMTDQPGKAETSTSGGCYDPSCSGPCGPAAPTTEPSVAEPSVTEPYTAGPEAATGGVPDSFDAFGAAGGAGAAAPGAGAAPYMIGDLLMANRVIQFRELPQV